MAEFTDAAIVIDPETLFQGAVEYLQSVIPGWEPADGNLDVWMLEAASQIGGQVAETAQDVPTAIFRRFGTELVGVPALDPSTAAGLTTWTVLDDSGYTIPEGTVVGFSGPEGTVGFETTVEVTILEGDTTIEGVPIAALEPGASGTGFTGQATLVDPLDFVVSVELVGSTTGGADGETDDEYLARLVEELRLQTPRPILPDDFATLARRVPGVVRALAIDGYNPGDKTYENERMVSVATTDEDGEANSAEVKAEVDALLQSMREVNFVVHVIDPTHTAIDVEYKATAWPGWDAVAVKASADAALAGYLSPTQTGQPPTSSGGGWVAVDKVRYLEVAQVLNSVPGLRYVDTLKVEGGTADVALEGAAALTRPGAITGTVT